MENTLWSCAATRVPSETGTVSTGTGTVLYSCCWSLCLRTFRLTLVQSNCYLDGGYSHLQRKLTCFFFFNPFLSVSSPVPPPFPPSGEVFSPLLRDERE